jgi:hypothetical protein
VIAFTMRYCLIVRGTPSPKSLPENVSKINTARRVMIRVASCASNHPRPGGVITVVQPTLLSGEFNFFVIHCFT